MATNAENEARIANLEATVTEINSKRVVLPTTSTSNTLLFNNRFGTSHYGEDNAPLTGDLIIDPTGRVEQGGVVVKWERDGEDLAVTGGTLNWQTEEPTEDGVHIIGISYFAGEYLAYLSGGTASSGGGGEDDETAPATPSITLIEDVAEDDETAPATPSITLIEDAT